MLLNHHVSRTIASWIIDCATAQRTVNDIINHREVRFIIQASRGFILRGKVRSSNPDYTNNIFSLQSKDAIALSFDRLSVCYKQALFGSERQIYIDTRLGCTNQFSSHLATHGNYASLYILSKNWARSAPMRFHEQLKWQIYLINALSTSQKHMKVSHCSQNPYQNLVEPFHLVPL